MDSKLWMLFIGTIKNIDFDKYIIDMSSYKVIVDEIILGSAFIHKTTTSSSSDKTKNQRSSKTKY
jgi:hypothetical protein